MRISVARFPGILLGAGTVVGALTGGVEGPVLFTQFTQHKTLSQALDTQPHGAADPPMPLRGEPDALQREIHHVTTTWETEVRAACGLSDPGRDLPGADVQRAVTTLTPRLRQLATLPPTTVYPTGCEDPPTDVAGWEAIHHLQHLHQRARGMLGRTHRTTELPGTCSGCYTDRLQRVEPRYENDPCLIYCANCHATWTSDEYDRYVTMLVWPTRDREAA